VSKPSNKLAVMAVAVDNEILYGAHLNDDLVGHMMLIKENSNFLHKHYSELANQDREQHLHHWVELEKKYLPHMHEKEEEDIDVGQDDLFV